MKTHIKLLRRLSGFGVILAMRSIFQWEGPYTSDDSPDGVQTVESDTDDDTREIYVGRNPIPLIVATHTGDNLDLSASPDLDQNTEFSAIISAMGFSATKTPTGYTLRSGTRDAEVLWDRILTLDAMAIAVRKLSMYESDINQVAVSLVKLANIASRWSVTRHQNWENGEDFNPRQTAAIEAEFAAFADWGIKGLVSITKHYDVRGSAFELLFEDSHPYLFPAIKVDWPAEVPVNAEALKTKFGSGKFAVKPTAIPAEVRGVLDGLQIEGNEVRITERLSPGLYKRVNEMLNAIGGRWHTSRQAHVFEEDPLALIDELTTTGFVFTRRDFEFFATPEPLTQEVMAEAGIQPGMRVLEPSAGGGSLALAAAAVVGKDHVRCIELMPKNAKSLQQLGFKVDEADFLSVTPTPTFDLVILNPPFSGFRDCAHIKHAAKFLKPGGRLVAIASTQWQTHITTPAKDFQGFLRSMNASIKQIPAGAFRDSGTDVPTTLVSFNVPEQTAPRPRVCEPVKAKTPVMVTESMQADLFAA